MTDQRSVCVRESKRAKIESCFVLHSTQHCVHKNSFFPPRDVTMDELRKQSSGWQSILHTFPFRSESFIIFCLCAYVYCLGLCAYIYILDFLPLFIFYAMYICLYFGCSCFYLCLEYFCLCFCWSFTIFHLCTIVHVSFCNICASCAYFFKFEETSKSVVNFNLSKVGESKPVYRTLILPLMTTLRQY